jgi:AcrR family transcriptional regulator
MPRVTDEYRAGRRDQIADAALAAFKRKGFQGTSMADIIAESGLSAGAIYGHFASKSEIIVAVATRVVHSRILDVERLAGMTPMPPPSTVLREVMDGLLHDLGGSGIMIQLWGEAVTDPLVRELAASTLVRMRETYAAYISRWQQEAHGLTQPEADVLAASQARVYVSAAQGFLLQNTLDPTFDREAFFESVAAHLPR